MGTAACSIADRLSLYKVLEREIKGLRNEELTNLTLPR